MVLFCFLHRREAFLPVLAMVSINSSYSLAAPYLGDVACYVVAGTLDVALIGFICAFFWRREFALDLCALALLSIACNLLGFLMYNAYQGPYFYNAASITIMMLQLLRLLVRRNGRDTPGGRRLSLVHLHADVSWRLGHGKDCQEEGSKT